MNRYDWYYTISAVFLNSAMTFLAHSYFCLFAGPGNQRRRRAFLLPCVAVISLAWLLPLRDAYFYSFTMILYLAYAVYARLTFGYRWQEALLYTMLFYFLTHFIVRTASWLSVQLLGYHFMDRGTGLGPALAGDALILVCSFLSLLVFRDKLKVLAGYRLSSKELLNVVLLGGPLIYFCHSEYLMTMDYLHFPPEIVLMRGLISLCAVYALVGIITADKSQAEQLERQKIQSLLESQYEQFRLKQESSERIMAKCHDLQKHLRFLETSDQSQCIESYRRELQQTIRDYDSLYETGNATVDALLSEAGLTCRAEGIQLICILNGDSFKFIEPMDLCTIFGNALDNAIESARQLASPEKKLIHVKASQEKGFLLLRFENYYEHTLNWRDGELTTSKSEKADHGYGLKSIGFAVKKYRGQVVSQAREGRFQLTITFPAEEGFI